ncbi:7689_t:CDS:1 [Acaulospora morrowiae]|uniref:7689_t:CDS:1 n=1 Tax=Acaulospora morrowiae TaxID=94023 RepID=A0A9N9B8L1_9GLOM|nr:7689_t:CDS:1 [Acaulospora morrowiae]
MCSSLPVEILQKIFSYLNVSSLHSCLLVNRCWCVSVIPLLWREPFDSFDYHKVQIWYKSANLIRTYVSCLPDEIKNSLMNENVILPHAALIKPTFEYSSFLQCLDYILLFQATGIWIAENERVTPRKIRKITFRHYLVAEELCKLFFRSSNLRYLKYDKTHDLPNSSDVEYIPLRHLPEAETCLSRLEKFCVMGSVPNVIISTIAQVAHNLKEIEIETLGDNDEILATLIGSQRNLRSLIIYAEDFLPTVAKALKHRVSNLRSVKLDWELSLPLDLFVDSVDLEKFSVHQYSSIARRETFEAFSNAEFRKLRKLHLITPRLYLDQMSKLIRNTGGSLRDLNIYFEKVNGIEHCKEFIHTIGKACPNIQKLHIFVPDEAIPLLPSLLMSCKQLRILEFLNGWLNTLHAFDVSKYLPEMGKVLPPKLSSLTMSGDWVLTAEAFRKFLEYCEIRLESGRMINFNFGRELTIEHVVIVEEYGAKGVLNVHPSTILGKNLKLFQRRIKQWNNI